MLAIDGNKKEVGMAVWPGGKASIQVYIYPLESTTLIDEKDRQLWETTTVIRSAVYQFVTKNGYFPQNLTALHQPFPDNYLSELPREPYRLKNDVTPTFTGDGGWLFSQENFPPNPLEFDLISTIKEGVKPNILYYKDIPFAPMVLSIDKDSHRLAVMSGEQMMRSYFIALGKAGSTPEEELYINKKVMNPNKMIPASDNVYGTRAMELSNISYAIHGTNSPTSIGKDVSHGCIRLNNPDMEELYAITPLYTPVMISRSLFTLKNFNDQEILSNDLYNHLNNHTNHSDEEDPSKMYYWSD